MGYWAKDGSYVHEEGDSRSARDILNDPNRYGEPLRPTGRDYPEPRSASEILNDPNRYGTPLRTTGRPGFDESTKISEMIVAANRERDAGKREVLKRLLQSLPDNYNELCAELEKMDYREDMIKTLVEAYGDKFKIVASQYKKDYSNEASYMVNSMAYAYLCLLETVKKNGFSFNQTNIAIYDVMNALQTRRRNDADVSIPLPVDYNPYNPRVDGVGAAFCVSEHIRGNQNMELLWQNVCPESGKVFGISSRR